MSNETGAGFGEEIALTDRFARVEASAGESAPGDYLILDLNTGRYYGVGEVGGFIWDRLDGERDLRDVSRSVSDRFEVEPERAAADLGEFVAWLRATGLAIRVEPS